jgi:hypothetical protein
MSHNQRGTTWMFSVFVLMLLLGIVIIIRSPFLIIDWLVYKPIQKCGDYLMGRIDEMFL